MACFRTALPLLALLFTAAVARAQYPPPPASLLQMHLRTLSDPLAVCNDGSPAQ